MIITQWRVEENLKIWLKSAREDCNFTKSNYARPSNDTINKYNIILDWQLSDWG